MPVTDELGQLALKGMSPSEVHIPESGFKDGYFETWLSRLAEPQPDLRYEQNLRNQAAFAEISEAVRRVLVERQQATMAKPPPRWLERLLRIAHFEQFTLLTFNYDTLVEAAIDGYIRIPDRKNGIPRIESVDLVDGLPPTPAPTGGLVVTRGPGRSSFRLLKLHGSIDCWWVTGDATGATIVRSPDGWRSDGESYAARGAVPGRSPFLVPPAAAKSHFYANPLTHELWQRAAKALEVASSVALVGYSLPLTDLVTAGMFADRLGGRETRVQVVNRKPEAPIGNLKRLGIEANSDFGSVESYVDELERQASLRAAVEVGELGRELPVLVGTDERNFARVTGAVRIGEAIHLQVEERRGWALATRAEGNGGELPVTVEELRHLLSDESLIKVDLPEGHEVSVIAWEPYHVASGYRGEWTVGILSEAPPYPD